MRKEKDKQSLERLTRIDVEMEAKKGELRKLEARWDIEKAKLAEIKRDAEALDKARRDLEIALRTNDYGAAGRIQYSVIPELEQRVQAAEDAANSAETQTSMVSDAVRAADVLQVISRATGIPIHNLLLGERERLLHMEDTLRKRIVGQDHVLRSVCDAVRLSRTGLHAHSKPQGVFLFLGPTGVGKTETCKALAGFLFDNDAAIVRVDMSEYMERHTVSRLIGAPPGYVGYEEGGELTEAVLRRPYTIVLFDEFEKAHPDVLNLLLQVRSSPSCALSSVRLLCF